MATLPAAEFFNTDPSQIIAESVAYYEGLTGRKLSPGQAEMLLINAFAYREQITRVAANEAARQNLLSYARYPMIDYLGELVGVTRLPASKALCSIQFTLVPGHGALTIPEGIRVQSTDGRVVFITLEAKTVQPSDATATVLAECTTEGKAGNGYEVGDIVIILDPQAYVSSAINTAITSGGADEEDDDALRERIRLAPSGFSCAGPKGAYVFFAKSAHPAIIDVGVMSLVPGTVNVFPLLENGETPSQEIIDAIYGKLNDEKIRPLNDTVVVDAPEKVFYTIDVQLTLYTGAITGPTVEQVTKNLQAYADDRKVRLGRDAVRSQISALSQLKDLVYSVNVVSPASDVHVDFSQIAYCTGINVTVSGYSNE